MPKVGGSRSVIRERSYKHNGRRTAKMKRLLLVEDDALFREGLALLLEWRTGLGSVEAGSLAEAQLILSDTNDKPACAIVDLDLPAGDGIDLLEQLRGLPVVALTGGRNLERRARALEAGADEVLTVSEPAEVIAGAVRRLVGE
jgi:DNA-binding NarL/FixJ family response regulator